MFHKHTLLPLWGSLAAEAARLHRTGLWTGPSYSWPVKIDEPSLFAAQPPHPTIGRDVKPYVAWSKQEAIRRGQGRMVCTHNAVGIFGYRACYYKPYPWWKRWRNALAWWLDQHRGALRIRRRLRVHVRRKSNSHFLR